MFVTGGDEGSRFIDRYSEKVKNYNAQQCNNFCKVYSLRKQLVIFLTNMFGYNLH